MNKRVYVNDGFETWGATINTAEGLIMNDTGKAFVRKNGNRWRCVEWFIVPLDIRERLLKKAA